MATGQIVHQPDHFLQQQQQLCLSPVRCAYVNEAAALSNTERARQQQRQYKLQH
jgi:hypothetical protein